MHHILADKHIYKIEQCLPPSVDISLFDPQQPLSIPEVTNALLIRTTIKLNADNFSPLPPALKFIATASSGTDHVDIEWLADQGIAFTNAAGCNARSVAEYVATALLIWADKRQIDIDKLKTGIIGVGHAGGETQKLLNNLGITTVPYDPPRAKRDEPFTSAALDEVLNCDVLTFHTPLTFEGNYPTYHWLDEDKLADHSFNLVINASRGGVVNEDVLFKSYTSNNIDDYILDVWENEPNFSDKVAKGAFIHTPHIAGYSVQAKLKATEMVVNALCDHFNLKIKNPLPPKSQKITAIAPDSTRSEWLKHLHPIAEYHQEFSTLINQSHASKTDGFSQIRTNHPLRNEYKFLEIPTDIKNKFSLIQHLQQ